MVLGEIDCREGLLTAVAKGKVRTALGMVSLAAAAAAAAVNMYPATQACH
jgi:hypothetical protein